MARVLHATMSVLNRKSAISASALLLAGLFGTAFAGVVETENTPKAGLPVPYTGELPSLASLNIRDAKLENLLSGLAEPWAFEFIAADEIILTQIRARMSRFNLVTGALTQITGLPEIATDKEQAGLLDVEVHPGFEQNHRIYFSYAISDKEVGRFYTLAVATATLDGEKLQEVREIFRLQPFGWSPANFGGALEFDGQGYLFVATGDRSEHIFAQDGSRLQGKILRLNDDGSVPEDNPFLDDEGVDNRIWALGIRNAQGLHFDAQRSLLFEAEHGPMGGDEVNVIRAGANYGWPVVTYGQNYTTEAIGVGTHLAGMEQPLWYYLPSTAISPLTVYRGAMFPEWDGHLLVGALKGKHVSKLDLDGEGVRSEYALLGEINDRVRDIKVAPDGSVLVLTQSKGLFRLYREPLAESTVPEFDAPLGYTLFCSGCHDTGAGGAPLLSEPGQWSRVLQQPLQETYDRTFAGVGGMPERGLCHICSDDQLRWLVDYVLEQLQSPGLQD